MTHLDELAATTVWLNNSQYSGMADLAPFSGLQDQAADATSDYGSDFSPDEVDILNELLSQTPAAEGEPDEPLVIIDIEDYEDPKGVRLPKILGEVKWSPPARIPVHLQLPEASLADADTLNGAPNRTLQSP